MSFYIFIQLFRKHLQHMVICRFPIYLQPVIQRLLKGMDSLSLYPAVWNDALLSFGLYLPNDNLQLKDLMFEIKKYAESQPIFSAHEVIANVYKKRKNFYLIQFLYLKQLYALLTLLLSHFSKLKEKKPRLELLQYFKLYIQSFSLFLSTLTFMWIYLNHKEAGKIYLFSHLCDQSLLL